MYKVLIGLAAIVAATGANAASVINFNSPTGTLTSSQTYTSGALSVKATGYATSGTGGNPGTLTNLYGKSCVGVCDENGLGLAGYTDNEINKGTDFIQLDVSKILNLASGASFFMNSTTSGETWAVYGSNIDGEVGAQLFTGTDEGSSHLHALTNWGQYSFYDFKSLGTWNSTTHTYGAGNVLLGGLSVTAVPEPSTWAMMLFGFGALGLAMRRQRKAIAQVA